MSQASAIRQLSPSPATSPFAVHSREFAPVLGSDPRLARVLSTDAHEGPVYVPEEDALYFTTVPTPGRVPAPGSPQVSIMRLALDRSRFPLEAERLSVVREDANVANGMALDHEGRLITCEQGTRSQHAAVTRVDRMTGAAEPVVDSFRGLPLNSPNDVTVKSDGTIWFTDPSYGHLQGFRPEPLVGDYVYRHDPATGGTSVVADSFVKPNGLAFSPDERILYVADSGANLEPGTYDPRRPHRIVAFEVESGRRLGPGRLFAVVTPGFPDGLKVDADGRVYASSFGGVQVFSPGGELIGEIDLPGAVNFTFGGRERNLLLITADDAIWVAVLAAIGPSPRLKGV